MKDNKSKQLTSVEWEVIILRAIKEMIDSMLNYEMFKLCGNDPDTTIAFKGNTHQQLFIVLLVDFLSKPDKNLFNRKSEAYLGELRSICNNPNFNGEHNRIEKLKKSSEDFSIWLNTQFGINRWFPTIGRNVNIELSRIDFIKLSGNIAKHNILRLSDVAKRINIKLIDDLDSESEEDGLLVLNDFYEIFFDDIFIYHSSAIAEFLNNIRWGIYYYLHPEFERSIDCDEGDPSKYSFRYPETLNYMFAQKCYCDLMNAVRNKPYMRRFQVSKYVKLRY